MMASAPLVSAMASRPPPGFGSDVAVTGDHVMPPSANDAYVAKVRKAGDAAEAVAIPGVGHFDVVIPTTDAWKQVADVVAREVARLR